MSNMKQIALGVMQYTQDYDERYPVQAASTSPSTGVIANFSTASAATNWLRSINPYLKSWQIYSCPSAVQYSGTATIAIPNGNSAASYMGNGVIFRQPYSGGLSLAAVDEPASVIMVREASMVYSYSETRPYETATSSHTYEYFEYATQAADRQHFDGGNLAFADGHVKWLALNRICLSAWGVTPGSAGDVCGDYGTGTYGAVARF
jgi:prepilin-type processing-associated H-X9-DG protein